MGSKYPRFDAKFCPEVPEALSDVRCFTDRFAYYGYVAPQAPPGGVWAEFGARKGKTAHKLSHFKPDATPFYLFDSWEGLPEDWDLGDGHVFQKEDMACPQPTLRFKNGRLVKGWFKDTLGPWVESLGTDTPLTMLHMDCDLYSSSLEVLQACDNLLVNGSIVICDDLFAYPNWRDGQWKAVNDWDPGCVEWLARTTKGRAAFKVNL